MEKSHWIIVILVVCALFFSGLFFLGGLAMMLAGGDWEDRDGNVAVVLLEGEIYGSQKLVREIDEISENEKIKAVVVRIDSPGGLVSPSQEIYGAVRRLRENKKVVASMGTLATSGAYYVAIAAEKILANEGSITGSIGVKINHINAADLVKLTRVKPTVLASGKYKDMGSPLRALSPEDEKIFRQMIGQMYAQFKRVVAKERELPMEKVDKIADGRVYTGEEAKELGLVDQIGSLQDAIDVAAEMAGIEGKPDVVYPKKPREHWLRYAVRETVSIVLEGLAQTRLEPSVSWRL